MVKKSDSILRVGDCVKILVPKFFVRCGYEQCFQTCLDEVIRERSEEIQALMDAGVLYMPFVGVVNLTRDKIARALAYLLLKTKSLPNGAERKIYTEERPTCLNEDAHVSRIRYVKTGRYERGYGGEDGDPSYLSNEKTHKLVELSSYGWDSMQDWWIEAANVVKLKPFDA